MTASISRPMTISDSRPKPLSRATTHAFVVVITLIFLEFFSLMGMNG